MIPRICNCNVTGLPGDQGERKEDEIIFFSIWVFFHEHSRTTGLQGKGGAFL